MAEESYRLADIEQAGCTISGAKPQGFIRGLKTVGYIYDAEGRHPDPAKVIRILDWPEPTDITRARAFLGVCVHSRIGDIVSQLQESDASYESE